MTAPKAYFNDFDPGATAMLRELIADGLISDGVVDDRSITEVQADDLVGFTRCHFFAGSGAWEDALEIAGWPEDWNTWTASLPCQPWSCAGKGEGCNDDRHLWPVFFDLVNQCRPDFLIGEQVEAAVGKGWLDGVRLDMARINYAFTFVVLPACCQGEEEAILLVGEDGVREERVLVGPPHIRQRIFWGAMRMADVQSSRRRVEQPENEWKTDREIDSSANSSCGGFDRLADMQDPNLGSGEHGEEAGARQDRERRRGLAGRGADVRLRNTIVPGLAGRESLSGDDGPEREAAERAVCDAGRMEYPYAERCREERVPQSWRGAIGGSPWSDYSIVICRDTDRNGIPKARRIPRQGGWSLESGVQLGADGAPRQVAFDGTPCAISTFPLASKEAWEGSRVGLLRLAGNAIDPRVAAVFIEEFMAAMEDLR